MKKISILLVALLIVNMFSMSAFAIGTNEASGFYNIGSKANVVITPYAGKNIVRATSQDVDNDQKDDTWYVNSDRLEVSYTVASNDGYYGVMLVEGDDLPTVDNAIFYIDQVTPKSNTVSFNVYPILPEESTALTLYISSSVEGFDLIPIPLNYVVDAEVTAPTYTLGDVDGDNIFSPSDALWVLKLCVGKLNTEPNLATMELAADVDKDGICTPTDALRILQFCVGKINSFEEIQGGNR